jgi:hypothetical protein
MVVAAQVAELFGGLGLFLLGSRWAATGLGAFAERIDGELEWRTRDPVRTVATGTCLAALQFGSGELPSIAAHLGGGRVLRSDRVALLAVGASFGPLVTGLLVLATSLGQILPAFALFALLALALLPRLRVARAWDVWCETAAGWALSIVGIAGMGSSLAEIAPMLPKELGADELPGALLLVAVGASLALMLRSPSAVAALALLAANANVINAWSGAALLIGVALAIAAPLAREARRGSSDERCAAAGHMLFCALWALFGLAFLASVSSVRSAFESFPGGPRVSLLLMHALTAVMAALASLALLEYVEHLVRARFAAPSRSSLDLVSHGVPQLMHGDLRRVVGETAAMARELVHGVLGGGAVTQQRWEAVHAHLEAAPATIDDLRVAQAPLRVRLSHGCGVHAAMRSAEAWREFGRLLNQHRAIGWPGEPALDRRTVQGRLAVARLVEASRVDSPGFSLEGWRCQASAVENSVVELRWQALSAYSSGVLHPSRLPTIEQEIESLRGLVRAADRAVSEWFALAGEDQVSTESPTRATSIETSSAAAA